MNNNNLTKGEITVKKAIVLTIVLAMAGLTACGSTESETTDTAAATTTTAATTTSEPETTTTAA
ncbi:MAG: hypothetical protein IJ806_03535, partial [Ruminococcus sp.]|nr:hypothetical protein [Ruminococcus sp.]